MRKNLQTSNRSLKCPLGEQDQELTQYSILLSQLGKPAQSKSELSLAGTSQMDSVANTVESSGL